MASSKARELLDSLVDHLQSQADLLPSLHAQLGLPPHALAADLERLRTLLAETVEAQIQQRNSEVNQWLERCEKVERDCSMLAKCLGASAKAATSFIELRKVTVLPKRHEQLVAHQENLHKIYIAKIEQRNALTTRLISLSRTLGPGFYSSELLVPVAAVHGNDELPRRDVTPDKLSKLEKEIDRGRIEINRRLAQLSGVLEQVVWLYSELGIELPVVETIEDLSVIIADEQMSCGEGSMSSASRTGGPGGGGNDNSDNPYDAILARYVSRLTEGDDEAFETLGVEGVDPTLNVMEYFDSLKTELDSIKSQRELSIQSMYDELEILWKRLGVDDAKIDAFVESNRGTTEETVASYEEEVRRMTERKRQSMSHFINSAREEIGTLWDDLMTGPADRDHFTAIYNDEHTEELLTRHEEEIVRLKEERRSKGPLLHSIRRYFEILEDEQKLADSISDSSRLTGRAPRGDPGRLLREEKMRKRVKKDKPRLQQELLQQIPGWEAAHQVPFRVNDERIVETLADTVEADTVQKDSKKRPRQGGPSSRATTPNPIITNATQTSAQKHQGPSSQGPPAKRTRLTPSTSGNQAPQYQTFPRSVTPSASGAVTGTIRGPLRVSAFNNGVTSTAQIMSATAKAKLIALDPFTHPISIPLGQPALHQNPRRHYGVGSGIGLGSAPGTSRLLGGSHAYGATPFGSLGGTTVRSVSASEVSAVGSRANPGIGFPSERATAAVAIVARKTRRESFKPRPSMDSLTSASDTNARGASGMWNGGGGVLKEESEDEEVF